MTRKCIRRRQILCILSALALLPLTLQAYVAVVNKTDNTELHIVPAPKDKTVVVDGDLNDWDLSGSILMYLDDTSRDTYSVRAAMMYDANYLYISGRVKDPTPMQNAYTTGGRADMSWNADAVQIRFLSNPEVKSRASLQTGGRMPKEDQQFVNHITLWYSTEEQAAASFFCYTLRFQDKAVNPKGVKGAYRKDADGQGYQFEYRVPWDVLRAPRPLRGGDRVQVQFQLHWGNKLGKGLKFGMTDVRNPQSGDLGYMGPGSWGVGIVHDKGNLKLAGTKNNLERPAGHIPIRFTMPAAGKASLAIYQGDRLIRTLWGAEPKDAGDQVCHWDGLDDYDQPVKAGRYTAKLLTHGGIKQELVCDVGVSGTPPYQNEEGTGGWAGDYNAPHYVSIHGDRVVLGTGNAEAAPTSACVDLEGNKLWGAFVGAKGPLELADNRGWFIRHGTGQLIQFSLKNGNLLPWPHGKPEAQIINRGPDEPKNAWVGRTWGFAAIAVHKDTIFISNKAEECIYRVNRKTGVTKDKIELPQPYGLAIADQGTLWAVSGHTIGIVDPKTKRFRAIHKNLDHPRHLALDQDGKVYVSLQGDTSQVWKLSPTAADKPLQTYGRKGGRPALGKFDPRGMLKPFDLDVDRHGRVWVAEMDEQPRRYSVWAPDGTLHKQFFGSMDYSTGVYVDPSDPDHVYAQSVRYRVDYEKQEWTPDACFVRPTEQTVTVKAPPLRRKKGDPEFVEHELTVSFDAPQKHPGPNPIVVYQGRKFLWCPANHGACLYEIVDGMAVPRMRLLAGRGRRSLSYWWADDNNDGRVTAEEVRTEHPLPPDCRFWWGGFPVDHEMNLYFFRGIPWHQQGGAKTTEPYEIVKWSFQGFNKQGGVRYEPPQDAATIARDPDGGAVSDLQVDPKGNIYALISGGTLQRGECPQGSGHRVAKFSPDGKKLWEYHKVHCAFAWTSNAYTPGDLVGVCVFSSGTTDRLVALTGYYGQYFLLDQQDGLFVEALGEDQRSPYTLDHHMVLTENFNGTLYRRGGATYFSGGDADARIWRLTGLDTIKRHTVAVTVSADQAAQAVEHAAAVKLVAVAEQGKKLAKIQRLKGAAADGRYDEWAKVKPMPIVMTGDRSAVAQVGYDQDNLYVRFQVNDTSPLRNAASDYTRYFKTGDMVELQLGQDLSKRRTRGQNRQDMKPGDLRLMITRNHDGKLLASIVRPVIQAKDKPHQYTYVSPVWKQSVDEVRTVDNLQMHCAADEAEYVVEAAVPWTLLGVQPEAGLHLIGDVGVVFGNQGGTRNAIRYMWSDKSPEVSINNDLPSELRLHPNNWGRLVLD